MTDESQNPNEEEKINTMTDKEEEKPLYDRMQRQRYLIDKLIKLREMATLAEATNDTENLEITKE